MLLRIWKCDEVVKYSDDDDDDNDDDDICIRTELYLSQSMEFSYKLSESDTKLIVKVV